MAYSPDGKTPGRFRLPAKILLHKPMAPGLWRPGGKVCTHLSPFGLLADGKILAGRGGCSRKVRGGGSSGTRETNMLIKVRGAGAMTVLFGASFSSPWTARRLACGAADNSVRIVSVPDEQAAP